MNITIINISLLVLCLGFIILIIYITIHITKKSITPSKCKPCINTNKITNKTLYNNIVPDNNKLIYDDRPSITYKKMFQNSGIGFGNGGLDVDGDSKITSFYIKSNK
jgi:hypothetical protein